MQTVGDSWEVLTVMVAGLLAFAGWVGWGLPGVVFGGLLGVAVYWLERESRRV